MGFVTYEVQTPVFEGPFDLLLHLILREEVDLYELSIAGIVDAYLTELNRMEQLDLEVATEFLLIAATLIELKAKRLLPDQDDLDLDEELALWEERDLLLARLLECKTFKDAAGSLQALARDAARSYPRTAGMEERFLGLMPELLEGIEAVDLREAYLRATAPKPTPKVDVSHIHLARVSVADAVVELADELGRVGRIGFRELTASLVDRIEIVVRFLAVLELFKQGAVELDQAISFGDIQVTWLGLDSNDEDMTLVDTYEG